MSNYNSRDIFFSFKEYNNNYNNVLSAYLSKHDDFDEKNFIENELDLYNLCLENATLTSHFCTTNKKYTINFGNCKFYISKIHDSLFTSKKVDDGWNLELALKYQVTFKKIIEYLKEKKELVSDIKTKKYNYLISTAKTPEVRKLLSDIFYKKVTLFSVVNYLKEKTNTETYSLFLAEFNICCVNIFNEFMFAIDEDDIKTALEQSENNLEYVYAYEGDLLNFSIFVKDIGGFKTVRNVTGLFKEQKENTIKLVCLNSLMINYFAGFCVNPIFCFENISHLKYVYNFLNNVKKGSNDIINEYNNSTNYNSFSSTFNIKNCAFQNTELPDLQKVFFVHYQCDDFNVSDEIKSLSIFADDKVVEFKNKSEADNIEEYSSMVNKLTDIGLIPIHWSQNRPYFGVEHIKARYYKLTANKIELEYKNSLNLSGILKHRFGEDYVNHPRLDNLALLNSFNGISSAEKGLRTFDANRVLLLSKIYFGILNKTLKISIFNNEETTKVTVQSINNIVVIEQPSLNNLLQSTIEDYLEEFKPDINGDGYIRLVDALSAYFSNGIFPILESKIIFKKINKKKLGWALKELYKSEKTDNLEIEYFRFAQENINLFEKEVIIMENFNKSNFYKTFTSNPAK